MMRIRILRYCSQVRWSGNGIEILGLEHPVGGSGRRRIGFHAGIERECLDRERRSRGQEIRRSESCLQGIRRRVRFGMLRS